MINNIYLLFRFLNMNAVVYVSRKIQAACSGKGEPKLEKCCTGDECKIVRPNKRKQAKKHQKSTVTDESKNNNHIDDDFQSNIVQKNYDEY
ncbi:hypothetical protein SNEBB_008828 [Seison nebaliae]|nr:hypothetical protein SNEBB_008828 [Seison nebaliae]